jgi:hypothetical protein
VNNLLAASEAIAAQAQQLQGKTGQQATDATNAIKQAAIKANGDFAKALLSDAEGRARRLASSVPWANPNRVSASRSVTRDRQAVAGRIRAALGALRTAATAEAADPAQADANAREALAQSGNFAAAAAAAYRLGANQEETTRSQLPTATNSVAPTAAKPTEPADDEVSATRLSPAKTSQFNALVESGRSMARQVIRFEKSGTPAQKENAKLARNYDRYLVNLKDSFRGVKSDREADRLISDAKKTNAYLTFLVKQSNAQ